ncbi:25063_t:CDS:1, partial [Racocetra persica]
VSKLECEYKTINPDKYHEAWNVLFSANSILVLEKLGIRGTESEVKKWA